MLANTFIHLRGIGQVTERRLWETGIRSWDDFLAERRLPPGVRSRSRPLKAAVARCAARLRDGDSAYFAREIPSAHAWRMYADFRRNAAFLDIETTGLSPEYSIITLVGILDRDGYRAFVHDRNLSDLREAVERYDMIVTFNGASFDLPFIEYHFGKMFGDTPHLDLRFPLRRMGLVGGLKAIERRLNAARPSALSSLDGFDAVRMWHMWKRGDRGALDTLIRYNAEDVFSLPKLAETAYNGLSAAISAPAPRLERQPYPEESAPPYDPDVIARLRRRGVFYDRRERNEKRGFPGRNA